MEITELYQELIIDHGTSPRNCHKLSNANCQAQGYNPLCGDKVTLYLLVENNKISDISFEGEGCAISMASASLLTEHLMGKSTADAKALFQKFHDLVMDKHSHDLGKLSALAGVKQYPSRIKCATLAWHAMLDALKQQTEQ